MKTYVIIFGFANIVCGGPIYHKNKIEYMEKKGWNVVVIPTNYGQVLIHGLERFMVEGFEFISYNPNEFTNRQRKKLLNKMVAKIPTNSEEIIIETGTDYTAYWGEALAQYLNAKHILILLDEYNDRITKEYMPFYLFKYHRGEMACISKETMLKYFKGYINISYDEAIGLSCICNNSVSNIETPFSIGLKKYDYNIASIGRLDKKFVPSIVRGMIDFIKSNTNKQIQIIFIGGTSNPDVLKNIYSEFQYYQNVHLIITGYIYPIPASIFSKIDAFISGAGSSYISNDMGVPTIAVDIESGKAIGVRDGDPCKKWQYAIGETDSIEKLLNDILLEHKYVRKKQIWNEDLEWQQIEKEFELHTEFINRSAQEKSFYDIHTLYLSQKQKIKKFLRGLIGLRAFDFIICLLKKK